MKILSNMIFFLKKNTVFVRGKLVFCHQQLVNLNKTMNEHLHVTTMHH